MTASARPDTGLQSIEQTPKSPAPPTGAANRLASDSEDSTAGGYSLNRFERILALQRQATHPLDPVAAVRAQAQLAHVEVPWLIRQLEHRAGEGSLS
jgi:hypothetical protein